VTVLSGDRPMLLVLIGAVVLGVMLLLQPLEAYLVTRQRVEALEAKEAALDAENRRLERRAAELEDAETIELLAREQQGFVRPGEVPYLLVPPEVERPRITAPAVAEPAPRPDPWALLLAFLQRLRA
jgi:cell division protein FtsB